ncbi:hypothetical protein CFP56_026041 [Quercus suber]|uniref:Uncharacterized protein n=1 Tax=Quercus suber TaxID=58331 RepID=A0AAW0K2E2_QUESU
MGMYHPQCCRGEMGTQTPASSDHTRTNRTPAMECYCIDLLLDKEHRKNRMGNIFNNKPGLIC